MSGFIGLFHRKNKRTVKRSHLQSMMRAIAHRGPDQTGTWIQKQVALGHQQLQTTPQSKHDPAPIHLSNRQLVISADARLDNRQTLIDQLPISSSGKKQRSDARLIAHAYRKWGEQAPGHLVGAFSFILWDQKKEVFFGARDHFGIRPFFYVQSRDHFFCASEVGALLSHPAISDRKNEQKIGWYLTYPPSVYPQIEDTFYQHVQRLLPAHSITITRGKINIRRFWHPKNTNVPSFSSKQEWLTAFRERFKTAVNDRLRANSSITTTLSGGLDSSSVTCMTHHLLSDLDSSSSLKTVHVDCGFSSTDEKQYVQSVLNKYELDHHNIPPQTALQSTVRLNDLLSEPIQATNPGITWATVCHTANSSSRVVLTGHGGDTMVPQGLNYLIKPLQNNEFHTFKQFLQQYAQSKYNTSSPTKQHYGNILVYSVLPYLNALASNRNWMDWISTTMPLATRLSLPLKTRFRLFLSPWISAFYRLRYQNEYQRLNPMISKQFGNQIRLNELLSEKYQFEGSTNSSTPFAHTSALLSGNLLTAIEQCNIIYAHKQLEPRFPFLDKRLAEICMNAPRKLLFDNGRGRGFIRNGLTNIVPANIRNRTDKVDFSEYIVDSLKHQDRQLAEQLLFQSENDLGRYIDKNRLRSYFSRFVQSSSLNRSWQKARLLSRTIDLALWLEKQ